MRKRIKNVTILPIMTRKDIQEILQVSKTTALRLLKNGSINSFKIGGRYRITKESLVEYIENSVMYGDC